MKRNDQRINSDKNLTVNKEERVANHPLWNKTNPIKKIVPL